MSDTASREDLTLSRATEADLGEASVSVRDLQHFFGEGDLRKQVLFDNRLELHPGEIVIMTGPSGSGKTTLLTLVGALRAVQQGSLRVLGRELAGATNEDRLRLRKEIGFIFQAHNLFASLSAVENVLMALELHSLDRGTNRRKAEALLTRLGLGHRHEYKPQSLSGGQRQRVAIARALAAQPRLILADEPTAALDKESGREVVNLLEEYAKEQRCTILMVTHDNRVLDKADRIVNMVDGRIISDVVVVESAVICDFLRRIPPFDKLTPSTLAQMADRMRLQRFAHGVAIIRQGDPGDNFYLIRSGEAEVRHQEGAQTRTLARLAMGQFFGEQALISGEPRNASVVSVGDVAVYALGKDDFRAALSASHSFETEIRRVLFERQ